MKPKKQRKEMAKFFYDLYEVGESLTVQISTIDSDPTLSGITLQALPQSDSRFSITNYDGEDGQTLIVEAEAAPVVVVSYNGEDVEVGSFSFTGGHPIRRPH